MLTKEIGGVPWPYRTPHENDYERVKELEERVELFPDSPVAPCWRHEIEFIKWVNLWDW